MLTLRGLNLIGSGVLAAGILLAQPPAGRRPWRNPDAAAGVRPNRGIEYIAKQLNLTEDQKAQLQSIVKQARTEMAALAPQFRDQREAVREAIQKNPDDNTIQDLAAKQGDLAAKLAAISIRARAKFYALLTPEQKEKASGMQMWLEGLFGGGPARLGS